MHGSPFGHFCFCRFGMRSCSRWFSREFLARSYRAVLEYRISVSRNRFSSWPEGQEVPHGIDGRARPIGFWARGCAEPRPLNAEGPDPERSDPLRP